MQAYSSQTMASYTSAIGHYCKINNYGDPTSNFLVTKVLEGAKRNTPNQINTRLPITKEKLAKLVSSLKYVTTSLYEEKLYAAMFCLSYYALLRISETTFNNGLTDHAIKFENVQISKESLVFKLHSSKTDQKQEGTIFSLSARINADLCPVSLVRKYLQVRPKLQGNLFININTEPVSRSQFIKVLKNAVSFCDLHPDHLSHSFRSGRATDLFQSGVLESEIMTCGRWQSKSVRSYIKL